MEAAPNKRSYRRMAAIRALLKGCTRGQVAELFGRSERMVRLWILMFNKGGIDALCSRPRPGRPRRIKLERLRDLLVPVLEEPAKAAQEHWTGVHGWLKEQLTIELGYRTTIRYLHELNYHLRANVIGAVCPATGQSFALIFDGVDYPGAGSACGPSALEKGAAARRSQTSSSASSITSPKPSRPIPANGASLSSTTPPGTKPRGCAGITSRASSCPLQPRLQPHRTALAAAQSRLLQRLHRPHPGRTHRAPLHRPQCLHG